MAAATITKTQKASGGDVHFLAHESTATKTSMAFTMYLPPQALADGAGGACPLLYYLSGLTCTNMNFIEKACAIAAVRSSLLRRLYSSDATTSSFLPASPFEISIQLPSVF